MFIVDNDKVVIKDHNVELCKVSEIESIVKQLYDLRNTHLIELSTSEQRFTDEGIDRYFKADPNYTLSKEVWKEDADTNWRGISGPLLFNKYQKHAELYCEGCIDYNVTPTYDGFKEWLVGSMWEED